MATDSRQPGSGAVARPLAILAASAVATGPALAHGGHAAHEGGGGTGLVLPAAVLGGGLLVLGTSVALGRRGDIGGRLKDLGVLLGLVGVLAGTTLGLV